jgi:RimJ/RimL family protein N-acetyltransferase
VPETLRTPRLTLHPWAPDHTRLLGVLANTPAVVRYIGDGAQWSDARVHDVSERNGEHWRRYGFGWRVAGLDPDGPGIGLIALNFAGEGSGVAADEYEIGWWLAPETWGRGLAREGAAALRDEAFERVGAPSIVARIAPANDASLAVAAAIGLTHDSDSVGRGGEPIAVLRLTAEQWREAQRRTGDE